MRYVLLFTVLLFAPHALAESPPTPTETTVESVGLFKNGLAVVRRSVTLPGDGVFEITDVPEPVHGTFWIESDASIAARVTTRPFEEAADLRPTGLVETDLAGGRVTIVFKDGQIPPVEGLIVEQAGTNHRHLILDTAQGRVYLDPAIIAYLRVEEPSGEPRTVAREKAVIQLTASGVGRQPTRVGITYLARGLAWMPSYRLDIAEASVLTLAQKAVIRNELMDLAAVDIDLISGFPSIEFGDVLSPMARNAQLAGFFSQLSQSSRSRQSGNAVTQQMISGNYAAPGNAADGGLVIPSGEGVDVHYQGIGRHDLRRGDALVLPVAEAATPYERIVEWVIPDTRDEWGRFVDDWRRQQEPDRFDDSPWDALRFTNPFDFPMTTAPAMIVDGHRFNGQRTSNWVNPGEQTTLRVTKALSVRTSAVENEEPGEREIRRFGGRNFREPNVRGEILVRNHRDEKIKVIVRREFSGKLIEAEGDPEEHLLESGVYSVNQRNELAWTLTLDPGETRTLTYRYSVLVLH